MVLKHKHIIITGAAGGLGRVLARHLIPTARRVVLIDRDLPGLRSLAGPNTTLLKCDLARPEQIRRTAIRLSAGRLRYDLLINCAGIGSHTPVTRLTPAEITRLITVDCLAPLILTSALVSSARLSAGSLVVNIGSISGELDLPGLSLYSSAKALLHSFTVSSAIEKPGSVRFMLVILGSLSDTDFGKKFAHPSPLPKIGFYARFRTSADSAASAIIRAISRDSSVLVYPGYLNIVLGFDRHFPRISNYFKSLVYNHLNN